MATRRYVPRQLGFETLVGVLVQEHTKMKEGLSRVKDAAEKRDFEAVSVALRDVDPIFRQHIVDEESTILRLLIGGLGPKGAAEDIRVFQQHRPIYRMMQAVAELASKSATELEAEQAKLNALFLEHTAAEQERVFPKAIKCFEAKGKSPPKRI